MEEFLLDWKENLRNFSYPITVSLIIAMIGIYVYQTIFYFNANNIFALSEDALRWWVQFNYLILHKGEFYRLFTSIFVHSSIPHLFSNCLFLIIFSMRLEEQVKGIHVLSIFLLGGLAGGIISLFLGAYFITLGSSGGVFALFGTVIFTVRGKSKRERNIAIYTSIIFFTITISQNTNIFSHFAGLIVGIVYEYFIIEKN